MCNGGGDVVDIGGEKYIVGVYMAERNFENNDKKEAGNGAPLFHAVGSTENFIRCTPDVCGPVLKYRGN